MVDFQGPQLFIRLWEQIINLIVKFVSKVIFVSKVVMLPLLMAFLNLFVLFAGDVGPYDDNKGYD
jgi:hypothetical protein